MDLATDGISHELTNYAQDVITSRQQYRAAHLGQLLSFWRGTSSNTPRPIAFSLGELGFLKE